MKIEEIQQKVMEMIQDQLQTNEPIEMTNILKHDLGFDSLDEIELIMKVEKEFGITIPDNEATNIKRVVDVVDYVNTVLPR